MSVSSPVPKPSNVLFVRKLPNDVNDDRLKSAFVQALSAEGLVGNDKKEVDASADFIRNNTQVLKAVVVRDPSREHRSRGYGYVTFRDIETASKAKQSVRQIGGKPIFSQFSATLMPKKGKKRQATPDSNIPNAFKKRFFADQLAKTDAENVKSEPEEVGQRPNMPRGKLNRWTPKKEPGAVMSKANRLIIRNLPFKTTESDIKTFLADVIKQKFPNSGMELIEATLPVKNGTEGHCRGFAFVQFNEPSHEKTQAVIDELNKQRFSKRKLAVDFALSRDQYEKQLSTSIKPNIKAKDVKIEKNSQHDNNDDDVSHSDDEGTEGSNDTEEEGSEEDSDSCDEDGENNDSDSDDSGDHDGDHDGEQKKDKPTDIDQGRTVFVRNLPFDVDDGQLREFIVSECTRHGIVHKAEQPTEKKPDTKGGRRPRYETKNSVLSLAIVVRDRETKASRGSAFLKFDTPENASEFVTKSTTQQCALGGRILTVSPAVSRESVGKKVTNNKATTVVEKCFDESSPSVNIASDLRNLRLAPFGYIKAGTPNAAGVSTVDLAKRENLHLAKLARLRKDNNLMVSDRRLTVHNLPPNIDDDRLRSMVYDACFSARSADVNETDTTLTVKRPRSVIEEAKVIREGGPKGRSRGFAFVRLASHGDALRVLRILNNNPKFFTPNKRLIVEFAVENIRVLKQKQRKMVNSRVKLDELKQHETKLKMTPRQKRRLSKQKTAKSVEKSIANGETTNGDGETTKPQSRKQKRLARRIAHAKVRSKWKADKKATNPDANSVPSKISA